MIFSDYIAHYFNASEDEVVAMTVPGIFRLNKGRSDQLESATAETLFTFLDLRGDRYKTWKRYRKMQAGQGAGGGAFKASLTRNPNPKRR